MRNIAISTDRSLIVTAADDKSGRIWDADTGELRHVLRPLTGDAEIGRMYAVAIHPTDDQVAIAGTTAQAGGPHTILLFQLSTGEFLRSFDARGGNIKRLAWAGGGALLLATYDGQHGFRAFATDGRVALEDSYQAGSYGLAVSPDGNHVATTSLDNTIHLYQVKGQSISAVNVWKTALPGPRDIDFSPDGRQLAVGYVGTAGEPGSPTIFDTVSGVVVRQFERPAVKFGDLRSIAWSSDGRSLYAGGSAYQAEGEHELFTYSASNGRLESRVKVARNSITDLVVDSSGGVLFASFDGSWGKVRDGRLDRQVGGDVADLRGPSLLRINDTGTQVAFHFGLHEQPALFDLNKRLLRLGETDEGLHAPSTRGPSSDSWENVRQPVINGRSVSVERSEVSRSVSYLPSGFALHGTSKALRHIDPRGHVLWTVSANAEIWSVNVTADARIAVGALSDNTIRWWRVADGELLMSLFMKPDGRWAVWTPQGYFDASVRADRMIGWSVNRANQPVADFFSLNLFRERFNRPDVIDQLLAAADISGALQLAANKGAEFDRQNGTEKSAVAAVDSVIIAGLPTASKVNPSTGQLPGPTDSSTVNLSSLTTSPSNAAVATAPVAPAPVKVAAEPAIDPARLQSIKALLLPPVVSSNGPAVLVAEHGRVTVPFTVQASTTPAIEVLVNGKPAIEAKIEPPSRFDGHARGIAMLETTQPGMVVQLIARDVHGVSEPLAFRIDGPAANTTSASSAGKVVPVPSQPAITQTTFVPGAIAKAPQILTAEFSADRGPNIRLSNLPRLFVVSIGISQYKNSEYRLNMPSKDAQDFMSAIKSQQGKLFQSVESRLLVNEQASRFETEKAMDWLRANVGPQDTGVLFLAGHGLNDPSGNYYFMPWDADHRNLKETAVAEPTIRRLLGTMRGRTLLFVDTCHAGIVGSSESGGRELRKLANELAASENGVIVFASSSGRQLSEEDDAWGNGAFTKAVVEGLRGKADFRGTGRVTFKSLDYYVSSEVNRLTQGRQTPVTNVPVGVPDFALVQLGAT